MHTCKMLDAYMQECLAAPRALHRVVHACVRCRSHLADQEHNVLRPHCGAPRRAALEPAARRGAVHGGVHEPGGVVNHNLLHQVHGLWQRLRLVTVAVHHDRH